MDSGRRPAHAKGTVLGLLLFLTYISVTYPMQSDIPVLDSLQTTAFFTEEPKTDTTRPYFKKTSTLSDNGGHAWQMKQANATSSAVCPTSKEKS